VKNEQAGPCTTCRWASASIDLDGATVWYCHRDGKSVGQGVTQQACHAPLTEFPFDEVRESLRRAGGDPDAIGERGQALVELLARRRTGSRPRATEP
jgi:hypothetical protein